MHVNTFMTNDTPVHKIQLWIRQGGKVSFQIWAVHTNFDKRVVLMFLAVYILGEINPCAPFNQIVPICPCSCPKFSVQMKNYHYNFIYPITVSLLHLIDF